MSFYAFIGSKKTLVKKGLKKASFLVSASIGTETRNEAQILKAEVKRNFRAKCESLVK
jgi:hypothetical protein